jgi:intraflagellar transport protein 81
LEEESRANSYIVKERLPKDIESKKKSVADLQRVVAEPAMGQADLEELHNKVCDILICEGVDYTKKKKVIS